MKEFAFHSPNSLTEALELLGELGEQARPLAGGTDLLLQMRQGERLPGALVSLRRLTELKGIHDDADGGLRLGAGTTLRELTRDATIRARYPCLAHTAALMGSEQVRSLATLGGNLCNGSPSADLAPPLIALGAEARISGPRGERALPLETFFLGPGSTALQPGELLTHLVVPPPQGRCVYLKHAARAYMDIPMVGVAAQLSFERGQLRKPRIVLGAVAPVPLRATAAERALEDGPLTQERIQAAAELAQAACSPISDLRSSQGYRRRMVRVMVVRALESLRPNGSGE